MRRALAVLACAVAFAVSTAAARAQVSKHILYRVPGSHGATVYLLGSVHLLTPDAGKLPSAVDTAFAHARTVVFETSIDSLKMRALEMIALARLPEGSTLRTVLSPVAAQHTDSILHLYGLSLDQMGGLKPWFVDLAMTQLALQRAGFKPDYGVDIQLDERAHEAGKPILGLESVDFQMHLFDSLSPSDQEHMLMEAKSPTEAAAQLTAMKDAWLSGNAGRLDSLLNDSGMSAGYYDAFVYRRNQSWIPEIERLIDGTSDALVVVGAAHLIGAKGVVALLRAKGYTVEQL